MGEGASCNRCRATDSTEALTTADDEIQRVNIDVLQPPAQREGSGTGETYDFPEVLSDEEAEGLMKPGSKVKIVGMKAAAHLNNQAATLQSYDASKMRWTVWVDAESKQVSVKLENLILFDDEDAEDTKISEGPTNVREREDSGAGQAKEGPADVGDDGGFEVGQTIRIQRMQKAKHLNGLTGKLIIFDSERGRWNVLVHCDLTHVAVQSKNLEFVSAADPSPTEARASAEELSPGSFAPGDYAKIIDMKKATHLNGEVGCLQSFDESSGRWTVVLEKGSVQVAAKTPNLSPCEKPSVQSKSKKQKKARDKKSNTEEAAPAGGTESNSRQEAYEKMGKTLEDNGCPQQ
mmetsp:Transcript_105173/g.201929  ORF Transcript_105173/g.201929 Transcript_105173/m.201929 type:complete len:348 (-) Transcript_105173:162-1205(-)